MPVKLSFFFIIATDNVRRRQRWLLWRSSVLADHLD
jgi:hypothetical protein